MIGRVRRRATFDALRRPQRRARSGPITVAFVGSEALDTGAPGELPGGPPEGFSGGSVQFAFSVGRRAGSAVVRNRIRRRLRVIVDRHQSQLSPGACLVSASPAAASASFDELDRAVAEAFVALNRGPRRTGGPNGPAAVSRERGGRP